MSDYPKVTGVSWVDGRNNESAYKRYGMFSE